MEKQVNIEDQIPVLQKSLAEQQERGKELEGYITALLAKKREMEQALQAEIAFELPDDPAVPAAINRAMPVLLTDEGSRFSRAISELTSTLFVESRIRETSRRRSLLRGRR